MNKRHIFLYLFVLFMPRREASEGIMFSGCPSGCMAVRPSGHVFLYYANIVQQQFIIYTNIQPLRQKFFTKSQGQRSRSKIKKLFC